MVVTAVNADGQSAAISGTTDVISGGDAPKNSARPSISGSDRRRGAVGNERRLDRRRHVVRVPVAACDSLGGACVDVTNATARSYGVRSADAGHRLRVAVTAKNANSSSSTTSDTTAVVRTAGGGGTVTLNRAPTITFISLRHFGPRVIARTRVCDDGVAPVTIVQRDLKLGLRTVTRRFSRQGPAVPRGDARLDAARALQGRPLHGHLPRGRQGRQGQPYRQPDDLLPVSTSFTRSTGPVSEAGPVAFLGLTRRRPPAAPRGRGPASGAAVSWPR